MKDITFKDFLSGDKNKMVPTKELHKRKIVKQKRFTESHSSDDFINESEALIENLKKKIDGVFYRFGMTGLERLDDVIIECVNDMIHPSGNTEHKENIRESRKAIKRPKASSKNISEEKDEPIRKMPADSEIYFSKEELEAAQALDEQQRHDEAIQHQMNEANAKQQEYFNNQPKVEQTINVKPVNIGKNTISDDDLAAIGAALQ